MKLLYIPVMAAINTEDSKVEHKHRGGLRAGCTATAWPHINYTLTAPNLV